MKPTIQCKYSCFKCSNQRQPVNVPARTGEEDVVTWLRQVATPALVRDHAARSPHCLIDKLSELLIPLAEGQPVGSPVEKPNPPKQ